MRYRIFQNDECLGVFLDRPAFRKAYSGDTPNKPIPGDFITFENKQYTIKDYQEHPSESFIENEFHEKEQDWFADITVE